MWDDLSLRNCNLTIEWTENQISFDGDISNGGNKWSMFKNRGMLFINLNVNNFLQKIEKMRHLAELTNASVAGISETKLDGSFLNSDIVIEGYNPINLDCSRKRSGVARFIKHYFVLNYKANMCFDTESIFKDIYLPKSKPFIYSRYPI